MASEERAFHGHSESEGRYKRLKTALGSRNGEWSSPGKVDTENVLSHSFAGASILLRTNVVSLIFLSLS